MPIYQVGLIAASLFIAMLTAFGLGAHVFRLGVRQGYYVQHKEHIPRAPAKVKPTPKKVIKQAAKVRDNLLAKQEEASRLHREEQQELVDRKEQMWDDL